MNPGPKLSFAQLDTGNYPVWIEHLRDHLLEKGLSTVFTLSETASEALADLGDADLQAARQLKLAALWSFIRRHLDE
jgi:hypothetical protein